MAIISIKVNVALPASLIRTLKEKSEMRQKMGELSAYILTEPSRNTPNILYIHLHWQSIESAKSFLDSQQGKSLIADFKSVCTPEILLFKKTQF